jgi:ferric-dicitrate binding protein FerR (iron transport regulator)
MTENQIRDLLERFNNGLCTQEEAAFVKSWYNSVAAKETVVFTEEELAQRKQQTWNKLFAPAPKRLFPYSNYIRYAAAILAIATVTCIFYTPFFNKNHQLTNKNTTAAIKPGENSAVLTLANGERIDLKNTRSGALAIKAGMEITNDTSNGVVIYIGSKTGLESNDKAQTDQKGLNTITTPRGGQYRLVLPDGSSILLNASSSLQFPDRFAVNNRTVSLIAGEAYFEVTKDPKKPFIVNTEGQQLTVLGTHFNISAYPDEPQKTTLIEGQVSLLNSSSLKKQILLPNQQAALLSQGFNVNQVNTADELAWKDGLFIFRQTPLADVLHQLCRWYNVDADFNNLPDTRLDAELQRTATLQDVIDLLNFTNSSKAIEIQITKGRRLEISRK